MMCPGVFFHCQLFLSWVATATHQHHFFSLAPINLLFGLLGLLPASSTLGTLHRPNRLCLASLGVSPKHHLHRSSHSRRNSSLKHQPWHLSPPVPASRWTIDHEASTSSPPSSLTFIPFPTVASLWGVILSFLEVCERDFQQHVSV